MRHRQTDLDIRDKNIRNILSSSRSVCDGDGEVGDEFVVRVVVVVKVVMSVVVRMVLRWTMDFRLFRGFW